VETSVENSVETARHSFSAPTLGLRLLGPLTVSRAGVGLALPASRKVRALLAYLAIAGRPLTRSHLCELLWDLPSDPRGELRWCLSKIRSVLDDPTRLRVLSDGDTVAMDLADCTVDVLEVEEALHQGLGLLPAARLEALQSLLDGHEFLEGLDLPRSPAFSGWLVAERRHLRAAHVAVLEHWVQLLPVGSDQTLAAVERWLAIAPFDRRAHAKLLQTLWLQGRLREAEEHLATTARRYEAEGQDWRPIGHAWREVKLRQANSALAGQVVISEPQAPEPTAFLKPRPAKRASLAVMPFVDRTPGVVLRGGLGDGMAHDVITRLSKLRSMFVIAQGTVFALSERRVDSQEAGRRLDVDYVASGTLRRSPDDRLTVTLQLTETRTAKVVWAEEFERRLDDTFAVLDEIGNHIVSSVANQIEVAERNRAVLKNPSSLNAWEAHHRGLWHMVRFNREDNQQARHFFESAIQLDPTFARPHAGLSFTHFQDAFLGWGDRKAAITMAHACAAHALMADEQDPAAHWALGRAMWLQARTDEAIRELHSAIELSPNYSMGHYTLAWFHCQAGDPEAAIRGADLARALSPMDPLLFGMLASRALALLRLGRYDEAADWGVRSAARPNAHVHIHAVAMFCLALAGRVKEAAERIRVMRRIHGAYAVDDFLQAFRLAPDVEVLVRRAATIVELQQSSRQEAGAAVRPDP
jgi:DNA-binding SARP family transcriptional activator/TolB-like protein